MAIDISLFGGLLRIVSLRMIHLTRCVLVGLFFDEAWPVLVGLLKVALRVLVKIILDVEVVLHQKPAVDDLESFNLDGHRTATGDSIGAEAPELWLIFCRVCVKGDLVFSSSKKIAGAVVLALELGKSLDRTILGEECNRIVSLDGDPHFVQVQQRFGLPERRN